MYSNRKLTLLISRLLALYLSVSFATAGAATADAKPAPSKASQSANRTDRSGKTRKGEASYYSHKFAGKKMANGKPMKPDSNVAASKTLPLGTKARVTNLENGKSADVVIEDRGPYVQGRIVDVTPKTADQLGFRKDGVAPVEVKPIQVPKRDDPAGDPVPPPK